MYHCHQHFFETMFTLEDSNLQKSKSIDGYLKYCFWINEYLKQQNKKFNICMHHGPE